MEAFLAHRLAKRPALRQLTCTRRAAAHDLLLSLPFRVPSVTSPYRLGSRLCDRVKG
jgi:hypothetical protein